MVELAVAGEMRLTVDDRELRRDKPSYTVDTLESVRAELAADDQLFLLLGWDAFCGLPSWHRWQELLEHCHLLVLQRPDADSEAPEALRDLLAARSVSDPLSLQGAGGLAQAVRVEADRRGLNPAEVGRADFLESRREELIGRIHRRRDRDYGEADDVAYLTGAIDYLADQGCVDDSRIYATGLSGGGRMASWLGCVAADRFAAIAPVVGLRAGNPRKDRPQEPDAATCRPLRPMPVIAFAGDADTTNPIQGGGAGYWSYTMHAAEQRWAQLNGCTQVRDTRWIADKVYEEGYAACRDGAFDVLDTRDSPQRWSEACHAAAEAQRRAERYYKEVGLIK